VLLWGDISSLLSSVCCHVRCVVMCGVVCGAVCCAVCRINKFNQLHNHIYFIKVRWWTIRQTNYDCLLFPLVSLFISHFLLYIFQFFPFFTSQASNFFSEFVQFFSKYSVNFVLPLLSVSLLHSIPYSTVKTLNQIRSTDTAIPAESDLILLNPA
jgi:hypothetical protein